MVSKNLALNKRMSWPGHYLPLPVHIDLRIAINCILFINILFQEVMIYSMKLLNHRLMYYSNVFFWGQWEDSQWLHCSCSFSIICSLFIFILCMLLLLMKLQINIYLSIYTVMGKSLNWFLTEEGKCENYVIILFNTYYSFQQ